jgi:hypothetical protein
MGKTDKKRRVYPKGFKAEAAALAEKREKPGIQAARESWSIAPREFPGFFVLP